MFKFSILCALALFVKAFASITPGGYYGYSYTPSPNSIEKGDFGYAARFNFRGSSDINHSVAMRPLSFMELGLGISKNPIPAAKIMYPLYKDIGQAAAFGFSGKRWYFAGMLQNISENENAYNLTLAGIYDINLHSSVGSVVGEANYGYVALSLENFWYKNKYGAAATFSLMPLAAFDTKVQLETSASISWRSPEHAEDVSAYASVQIKAPILQTEKDPIVYIDINPAFDHSVSFARNDYEIRFAMDMDAVLAVPFDFYLVGALSPSLKTKNQSRMPKRDILDRYYLLWDSEKIPLWAACGMLNTDIYGCQTELAKEFRIANKAFNATSLTLGYTDGDQKGINAVGQIPLHPKFSGLLSKSQFFAEGGLFLGEKLATQLNFRQGTQKKYLQMGGGYDFERKSIFGELSLQYDFSISKQISGMAIRLAPNARHSEYSPFYVFDYDIPIYQEGNSERRLHNFPWKK